MCAHGGMSDPFSRCIIRSKCIGNDIICYRKPRDVLISQSNVCSSLVRPIKGHVWGNKAAGFFSWGTKHGTWVDTKGVLMRVSGRL